jgi:hypothetical protein
MEKQTRRKFLMQSSLSAAVLTSATGLAVAACAPAGASAAPPAVNSALNIPLTPEELAGPLVVYIRNLQDGEIGVLAGSREVVYRDPDLVHRLLGIVVH